MTHPGGDARVLACLLTKRSKYVPCDFAFRSQLAVVLCSYSLLLCVRSAQIGPPLSFPLASLFLTFLQLARVRADVNAVERHSAAIDDTTRCDTAVFLERGVGQLLHLGLHGVVVN